MATPITPQNFDVQQANGQVLVSWALTAGATSYNVQRSTDGVTYASVATPTGIQFLDDTVALGTLYYYKVAAVNGSGTSPYTSVLKTVPAPTGELSLMELRQRCKEKADRVNSQFVTDNEWNFFIGQAMYELYDMLVTAYEDYYKAPNALFTTQGNQSAYPLPNGVLSFTGSDGSPFVAQPFYKLLGVDLAVNTPNNAFVTVPKYNLIDRNRYIYPNTASTVYGVFNLRYRVMGDKIEFIPTPSSNQLIRLLYIPRLPRLLLDTDLTTLGISGWLQYPIVRAAKYALDKEESDTSKLDAELMFLKKRIEDTAPARDAGSPDTISDSRQGAYGSNNGYGFNGPIGGW